MLKPCNRTGPDQHRVFWVLVTDEVVMTIIIFSEVITVRAVVPVLIIRTCHVIYHFLGGVEAPHFGHRLLNRLPQWAS